MAAVVSVDATATLTQNMDSTSSCASATYFGPFFAASSAAFPAARAPARIVEWLQITIDAINQASSGVLGPLLTGREQ
jgi:hypothetical protein